MSEPLQKNYQLKLPEAETARLASKIQSDYRSALSDHNRRMNRWREYYRHWRALPDQPAIGEEEISNLHVPLIRWNVFTKLAKEMDSLFGDDAEITAIPTGPSDARKVHKIGKYMTWRVFNSMKLVKPFCSFVLRKLLFGKSHAYSPWERKSYEVAGQEIVDYEGPGFTPLWPDDFIVPAEEVTSLHDFSFVIRRYRVTPDELLQGEAEGRYQGIEENFEKIVMTAQRGLNREFEGEEIKREADDAEGILYQSPLSSGETLMVLEWYGKWRMLKGKETDAGEYDFSKRELRQSELVIRYLWDTHQVIGVQDLAELYPTKRQRRPFVEASTLDEGRYWPAGICEMLIDMEDDLKVNHNTGTQAAELSVGPAIAYRPATGLEPKTLRLEPYMMIPVDNPASDIRVLELRPNLAAVQWKQETVLAYVERLTGLSDLALGRQSDRPNAPRTARQTVALLEEGNVRISLDSKILREDMSAILTHFWELEWMFSTPQMFFRVTEDDADGLFPVKDGGAWLTEEDRDGRYDFRLVFANSVYSREAAKERTLARYQIDMVNPLILNNPQALWKVTNDVHEALGDPNFASLVPEPSAGDMPVNPKDEWVRIQEGEDVFVHPMDNDELHLIRHRRDIQSGETDQNGDKEALEKLTVHYMQHIEQLQQKKIVQAVMEQAASAVQRLGAGVIPGQAAQPGQPQQGPGVSQQPGEEQGEE